jgi:hypothetical protein
VSALTDLIRAEISEPVDLRVTEMAAAIAAKHGEASRIMLFYGSCLREEQLDGLMLDFYLIVSDYAAAYPKRWLATANRLIPPNVFPFAHNGLAAKYAVLSEADFAALNRSDANNVSVWARFAQPVRLVWACSEEDGEAAVEAVAAAPVTLLSLAAPMTASPDSLEQWRTGFGLTYQCELRAERTDRSGSIVDADPERYARVSAAVETLEALSYEAATRRWASLRRRGKFLSVARLAKASLTFAGGIDYLAWKINRHAGTKIEIKPWQRRWPLLGAVVLVPRLLLQGAVR